MQILYVHRHFSTPQGSVGTHAYETARRLVERGHQVTIVCGGFGANNIGLDGAFRRGKREGNVDGIRVMEYQLGNSHAPNWLARCVATSIFALRCVAVALREPYDVLCATSTPPIASILGVCASLLRRKPMVLEVRVLWSERLKALGIIKNPIWCGVASTLEWISYHSATRFVALSPMIAESIQIRGIPASHIKMIPNGCDIALFAAPVSAWRPAEVRQDDVMAVYAGAHEHANGLLSVLHAAAELKRRGAQHIKVVLVGAGQFKQMLVEYARQEKLDNVLFLDAVPKTKLAGLMATADIGLQISANIPALYEGTGSTKFFDYLASGTPVLCNHPGWLAELITLHQCGFVVTPDNPKAFADALEYAANNRAELEAMGPRAQQLARTAFARDQQAEQFCRWLEQAVKEKTAA